MTTIAQHRASAGLQAVAGVVEDHFDRWAAEVDRLKVLNAGLVAALEQINDHNHNSSVAAKNMGAIAYAALLAVKGET